MNVRILPAARTDLELAADFYESQYAGLGAEFLESLVAATTPSAASFCRGFMLPWSTSRSSKL